MIAASAALSLTGAPFDGPVAGLRVGRVDGQFKAFLSPEEREASDLDLVVAGIESGVMMVEAGADEVSEDVVVDAIAWAHEQFQVAIQLQRELAEKVGVTPLEYELVLPNEDIQQEVDAWVEGKFGEALRRAYPERNELISKRRARTTTHSVANTTKHSPQRSTKTSATAS
jgi:polyribonucleotide nucleotidyltransferase